MARAAVCEEILRTRSAPLFDFVWFTTFEIQIRLVCLVVNLLRVFAVRWLRLVWDSFALTLISCFIYEFTQEVGRGWWTASDRSATLDTGA
jgi:hypothetical protein